MKDIYEVIRQKEAELQRIQHEIEALRLSAKLLEDAGRPSANTPVQVFSAAAATKPQTPAQPTSSPSAWATAKQFP
jgi:prefoldin subunit 5